MTETATRAPSAARPMLDGLRVLDLADERGSLCGRQFAELGADVIKIEPIGGCPSRRVPPFVDGIPGPDRSAHFLAYAAGKRSVTLNLDTADGQGLFLDLVRHADFVVETVGEAWFRTRGLGYETLAAANPAVIYTTITPFGDRGKATTWRGVDITCWAAGGMMFLTGIPGRPPLQMTEPQASFHAGAEAATASLLAYFVRQQDGLGQRVVIDTQACVVWTLMNAQAFPVLHRTQLTRTGGMTGVSITRRSVHECADGHVTVSLGGGNPHAGSSKQLVAWMADEGMAPDWLQAVDFTEWSTARFMGPADPEFAALVHRAEEVLETFLMTKTKTELYHGALQRRILLAPVASVRDIAEDVQLAARDYFRTVPHDTLGRDVRLPGPPVRFSGRPAGSITRAPRLGEHNAEVYGGLLGVGAERLRALYATGAI